MKAYFSRFGTYLLYFIGAMWFGLVPQIILRYPLMMIFEPSTFTMRICTAVFFIIGATVLLYKMIFRVGYKGGDFEWRKCICPILAVFAIFHIAGLIFGGYVDYLSGGALNIANAIWYGSGEVSIAEVEAPKWLFHIIMLMIEVIFYLPAFIAGEYFGAKKRTKERNELTSDETV